MKFSERAMSERPILKRSKPAQMTEKAPAYAILWASQTGNAEWIAKNIHKEAETRGFKGECFVMNEYELVRDKFHFGRMTGHYIT
jgi:sulfite reductase alpha subunit-like flavoprotein